ncbi:unnamed protein product [Ectocarpus sp. 4 AP-2014]
MGKARRLKSHTQAARAAADAGTAVAKQQQEQQLQQQPLQMDAKAGGVLDGLASLNALTRESSCAAIASLFEKVDGPEAGGESWAAAQRLIAGGLVKKLLPRMVDRVPGVKLQAIGAMRNISAVRDPRMCEVLVHDDCLTPVLTLLDRMSTAAAAVAGTASAPPPGANTPKTGNGNTQQQQQLQPALVMTAEEEAVVVAQLVATLCNLLAAVDVAVGRFTRQGGLQVVMRLLMAEGCRGSSEVFGGALQALHVATDSNEDLSRQLAAQPGAIHQISALVQGADVTHVKVSASMRVQAAGVLVNVAGLSSGGEAARSAEGQAELTRVVLPLLLKQMAYDPTALQQACVALALEKQPATPGPAAGSAESSMDVDGEAGAGAAAAAAGAASAAAPMQMETTTTGAAAGATKGGEQEPAQGTESENDGAAGNDVEGGEEKKAGAVVDQPDRDAQLRWEWKLAVAEPLKLTAEVMTNLCALASGDGEEEEEEEEWGSDDEDAMEQAACGGAGRQQQASEGALTAVLLEAMAEGGALHRTLATLQALLAPTPRDRQRQQPTLTIGGGGGGGGAGEALPPPPAATAEGAAAAAAANTDDRLALPAGVAGDLADLRATVALCAANLVQNLPAKALGENPHALWAELCGMCEAATERAPSCVETVTGVMWGLVRRAGPVVAAGVQAAAAAAAPEAATQAGGRRPKPSADPLPLILRLCDPGVTRAFEARVNAVGMLGALGSAAAGAAVAGEGAAVAAGSADLGLGRALVQAMEDPHVLVQAEALNAVMDVFGDDGLDAAFRASGAPAALAAGVPAFRRKVKQEGKALGRDAMCHLKETALNAGRFVKYKQASEGASTAGGKKREGRR